MSTTAKCSKTFRIAASVMRGVEKMAVAENRTVNNMVETILKRHLLKSEIPTP